ncbi:MAG: bifunctional riboflavin kinase/FAD synthetase [Lachnospiraceae bacterium]|nr:bifunctional riboflavin kinase/FAD synthetase [Lachnospiraceae bacterium]
MKYFRDTMDFNIREPSSIALGKFDGLHQGHRKLLEEIKNKAESGCKSVVFTFDIPPGSLSDKNYKVLLTNQEKEGLFSEAGIDYVIECPFTDEFKKMEPDEFLRFLTSRIDVKQIAVGTDFRFGRDRKGSCRDLIEREREFGYQTVVVDKVMDQGKDISSTRIREHIQNGEMEEANRLLGYSYFLTAGVQHGSGVGRRIGAPTVNQLPPENKLLPKNGVYVSVAVLDDRCWYGVSDIGYKPTIEGEHPLGVETHLFDFDEEVYDREIRVAFLSYLRPEQRFDSVSDLSRQVAKDCENAQNICENITLQRF